MPKLERNGKHLRSGEGSFLRSCAPHPSGRWCCLATVASGDRVHQESGRPGLAGEFPSRSQVLIVICSSEIRSSWRRARPYPARDVTASRTWTHITSETPRCARSLGDERMRYLPPTAMRRFEHGLRSFHPRRRSDGGFTGRRRRQVLGCLTHRCGPTRSSKHEAAWARRRRRPSYFRWNR